MRHVIVAITIAFALGCSNNSTSKNSNPNDNPGDAGDVGARDAANNVNNQNDMTADATPAPDDGPGPDTGPSSDTGPDQGPPDMGLPPSPCPATLPAAASNCTDAGLECEYGDDPREGCRSRAQCADGSWLVTAPRCEPLPTVTCPTTRDDASGEPCDVMDAYCEYDQGLVCHCTNCVDGPVVMCAGDPTWMCEVPNQDTECPAAKPRLGDSCRPDAKKCTYHCGPDGARLCRSGTWGSEDGGSCPISTVRVKRDIRYLSSDELEQISEDVQSIPLAHWEYKDPALGRGEKLGFIIEDLPPTTPAVDRQRLMVDLYGYTSMLVADAQAREKRMRELEARIEELEANALQCNK